MIFFQFQISATLLLNIIEGRITIFVIKCGVAELVKRLGAFHSTNP